MSFMCDKCWDKQKFVCPTPKEYHPRSYGPCEDCRTVAVTTDCPTSHVSHLIRAAYPETFKDEE